MVRDTFLMSRSGLSCAFMTPFARIAKSAGAALIASLLLTACASAPTQEMSNARQSVQAAQAVGAESYATHNLDVAREYLARAERELELRYFARARHDAIVAQSEALKAHRVALALRSAREAIDGADAEPAVITEAESLLREAMRAAGEGRDRRAIGLAGDAHRLVDPTADSGD